jgi:UDP-3-O-acyl N-acetylglucosamine deacetylase
MSLTARHQRRTVSSADAATPTRLPTRQQTITQSVCVDGFGYWSGEDVRVQFRPAAPDTGIVFVRGDLASPVRIPALAQYRIETPRRTNLSSGGATVEMVEHIMAALAGLEIDNCEIWVDKPEMPGCDGSSQCFVNALQQAGTTPQDVDRSLLVVDEITRLGDANHWIEARPSQDGTTTLRYRLDYSDATLAIGRQTAQFVVTPDTFCRELASSRTFMLEEEARWLLSQGFGTRVKPSDVLVFDQDGPIENELRFPDECVRHKILDMLGDLALAGRPVVGTFIAHRSGHRLNAELVKVLLTEGKLVETHRRSA